MSDSMQSSVFDKINRDIETQFENYQIDMTNVSFGIFDLSSDFFCFLGINEYKVVKVLPNVSELEDNTIYIYYTGPLYHCIYHFTGGIVFNSDQITYPLPTEYVNITSDRFEPTSAEYDIYLEFIMSQGNLTGIPNILHIEANCDFWCLLVAFVTANDHTFGDLENDIQMYGVYKRESFNKLHFLSMFMAYCCVNHTKLFI